MLVSGTLPGHAIPEISDVPHTDSLEQRSGSPRHGLVATISNLRASRSVQSEVVAIAKLGMPVEIVTETERWYRVKTSASTTEIGEASTLPGEPQPENTADSQNLGLSSAVLGDTPLILIEGLGARWSFDAILNHVQGLSIYVVPALVLLLALSLALQLRAARQLRRAMQELGEIFDIVEEIYANSPLARTGVRGAIQTAMPRGTSATRSESPVIEFSSVERAALKALSHQREISEGELANILAEQGFTGVLVKAVIGNILRKTRATGLPWVEVRYIQGRYRYQLRSEAVPSLSDG
jgi:hypothetical protein